MGPTISRPRKYSDLGESIWRPRDMEYAPIPTRRRSINTRSNSCPSLSSKQIIETAFYGRWARFPMDENGPAHRSGHFSVSNVDFAYIGYGTARGKKRFQDLWSLDLQTYSWSQIPLTGQIPSPRKNSRAYLKDNILYVFGGNIGRRFYNDLYAINVQNGQCTLINTSGDLPSPVSSPVFVIYNDNIYLFGGIFAPSASSTPQIVDPLPQIPSSTSDSPVFNDSEMPFKPNIPSQISVAVPPHSMHSIQKKTSEIKPSKPKTPKLTDSTPKKTKNSSKASENKNENDSDSDSESDFIPVGPHPRASTLFILNLNTRIWRSVKLNVHTRYQVPYVLKNHKILIYGGVETDELLEIDLNTEKAEEIPTMGLTPPVSVHAAGMCEVGKYLVYFGGKFHAPRTLVYALDTEKCWWFVFHIRPDRETAFITDGKVTSAGLFMLPRINSFGVAYSGKKRELSLFMGAPAKRMKEMSLIYLGDALSVLNLRDDMLSMLV